MVDGCNCSEKERLFLQAKELSNIFYPNIGQANFEKIPGCPIGYWVSDNILSLFTKEKSVSDICFPLQGLSTTDNGRYIRVWYEVSFDEIKLGTKNVQECLSSTKKWYPINKGGGTKKWYGNQVEVINWYNNGEEIKNNPNAVIRGEEGYFKPSVTWNKICSTYITFRYFPEGFVVDSASNAIPCDDVISMLGYLGSKITNVIGNILNPTLNLSNGVLGRFPYLGVNNDTINQCVKNAISITKSDWDAHETSWDFEANPLVDLRNETVANGNLDSSFKLSAFVEQFKTIWEERFNQLHEN